MPEKGTVEHLLRALLFMKVYPTEQVLSVWMEQDIKTNRKWNWQMIKAIAELETYIVSIGCYFSQNITLFEINLFVFLD